jgi:integrase
MRRHEANKHKLSEKFLDKLKPKSKRFLVWDTYQRGLAVRVQPSGEMSYKCIYPFHGRPRWYHIGGVAAIELGDARKLAGRVMFQVAEGKDPAAERKAERGKGTFEELHTRYVEEFAKKKNKSWKQPDALVRRYLMPKWGKLQASTIARADVRAMFASIEAPVLANQVILAASAVFSWAVKQEILTANPCKHVDKNTTGKRARILSDSEVSKFWKAFDTAGLVSSMALKMILLSGQRPGEVAAMRREHIVDGWWQMPGKPVPALGWPGTKNKEDHRVWLSKTALAVLEEFDGDLIFASPHGNPVGKNLSVKMQAICKQLGVTDKVTPHDLRRTFSSAVTRLGFGRDAMNRVTNHKQRGVTDIYDRHSYEVEDQKIMNAVADHLMRLVAGERGNVVAMRIAKK